MSLEGAQVPAGYHAVKRLTMTPEEVRRIQDLYRAAQEAKTDLEKYATELGSKYAAFADDPNCFIQFDNDQVVLFQPQRIFTAH